MHDTGFADKMQAINRINAKKTKNNPSNGDHLKDYASFLPNSTFHAVLSLSSVQAALAGLVEGRTA